MKKLSAPLLLTVVILMITVSCSSDPWNAALPKPDGPYKTIGTTKLVLDDPRQLLVQVWYPAENEGAGIVDPMISKLQLDTMAGFKVPMATAPLEDHLPSNSFMDAPILYPPKPYPIIIFDHGFEGYEKQNLTQMEELASWGYIVFAVNHPGESAITQYPDGEVLYIDHERYPSLTAKTKKQARVNAAQTRDFVKTIRDNETDREKIETMRVFASTPRVSTLNLPIKERTRDILYVMEKIAEGSKSLPGIMDITNVGMYGHSMGGNATVEIATRSELPVVLRVAANLDGPQLIFPGDPVPELKVPFLMAYSNSQMVDGVTVDLSGANDWLLNISDHETWRVVFNGSTHLNFSDLTFIRLMEGKSTGDIDGTAMGLAQEKMLVMWFNRHLKNEFDKAELDRLIQSYDKWDFTYKLSDK